MSRHVKTCVVILMFYVVQEILSLNPTKLKETDEYRLVHYLFDGYNHSEVRPVKNSSNPINVEFEMNLGRLVEVNPRETTLVTDVWVTQKWNNPFLTWKPEAYGGISTIHAKPKDVWVPDTALVNNAESDFAGSRTKYKTLIILSSNGDSVWMSPATFKSSCFFDVSFFPFDTQECELTFGSWTYNNDKMTLSHITERNHFAKTGFESGDWSIPTMKIDTSSSTFEYYPGEFDRITYSLKLKRKPIYFIMYLVVPSVLISILVLFSFKIPVDSGERIGLCTTALLAMSVFLLLIGEHLPESSENIPLLAIASVLMMIEITFGFLATILVLKCHHSTHRPPKILMALCCIKITETLDESTGPDDPESDEKPPAIQALMQAQISLLDGKKENYQREWQQISKNLDRFFFYLFLVLLCGTLAGIYLLAPLIAELEHKA